MLLSLVVPTKNEAKNIVPCLQAFDQACADGWCEKIVVDNSSTDSTTDLALSCGAKVFQQGPERSAQRNRGFRESSGDFVIFLDADMRMPPETLAEIRSLLSSPNSPDTLYIREVRIGSGFWIKVRNFERSFYDATCIDGLRVFRRSLLEQLGGYDSSITGFEDWDIDRRALDLGARTALTQNALLHDEGAFTWKRHLAKKGYYSLFTSVYRKKWNNDATIRKQLGLRYRFFGVFFENGKWKKALRHPILMSCIWLERFIVGLTWLLRK